MRIHAYATAAVTVLMALLNLPFAFDGDVAAAPLGSPRSRSRRLRSSQTSAPGRVDQSQPGTTNMSQVTMGMITTMLKPHRIRPLYT